MLLTALLLTGAGCQKTQPPEGARPTPVNQPAPQPVPAAPSAEVKTSATVTMSAQSGSGETGTATLTAMSEGKTKVVISLVGEAAGASQPAHIHVGSCPTPGAILYPLNAVVNGKSETTLNASLASILNATGALSINVHMSATELTTYVSCGDIKK
jgi:hypothetical protein